MRPLLVVAALAATAHADTITVFDLGVTGDMRAHAHSFDATANARARPAAGLRLTLSFERRPLVYVDHPVTEARLVPELFIGALGDDRIGEGYLGAGARLEGAIAGRPGRMSGGVYLAGRGLVIGSHHDSAAELAIGEYCLVRGGRRVGWETGAMLRPRDHEGRHELDALLTLYVGWN